MNMNINTTYAIVGLGICAMLSIVSYTRSQSTQAKINLALATVNLESVKAANVTSPQEVFYGHDVQEWIENGNQQLWNDSLGKGTKTTVNLLCAKKTNPIEGTWVLPNPACAWVIEQRMSYINDFGGCRQYLDVEKIVLNCKNFLGVPSNPFNSL